MADKRIPILLQTPAAKRFVSAEPMVERFWLGFLSIQSECCGFAEGIITTAKPQQCHICLKPRKVLSQIDQVIIGCESGPNRRPCKIEWVRNLVKQCQDAGVKTFIKQLDINGKVVKDINLFPKDLQMRQEIE